MIVAITGGTGFIGRELVLRHLAQGDVVRGLSRRTAVRDGVQWHHGDLSSADLNSFVDGADVLYHCAGEIRDESLMKVVHVDGTRRLIEAANGRIGRLVQLSSVGAYGKQRLGVVTEETAPCPDGTYEVTKVESDDMVSSAALEGAFEQSILRPSNVYGPEMSNQSLFGLFNMVNRGRYFFIGEPGASANYIHVDNVVDALVLCGIHPRAKGEIYNLSDYRPLEQFIAVIASVLGRSTPSLRLPEWSVRLPARLMGNLPGFPLTESRVGALTGRVIYSTEKIEQQLDYQHRVSMEAGLEELVRSWQQRVGEHGDSK